MDPSITVSSEDAGVRSQYIYEKITKCPTDDNLHESDGEIDVRLLSKLLHMWGSTTYNDG